MDINEILRIVGIVLMALIGALNGKNMLNTHATKKLTKQNLENQSTKNQDSVQELKSLLFTAEKSVLKSFFIYVSGRIGYIHSSHAQTVVDAQMLKLLVMLFQQQSDLCDSVVFCVDGSVKTLPDVKRYLVSLDEGKLDIVNEEGVIINVQQR